MLSFWYERKPNPETKAEPRHAVIRAKIASFLTYWLDVASVLLGIEITNKCLKMIITFIFGKIKYITKNKYLKFKTFLNVKHCLCINLIEFLKTCNENNFW